MDIALPQSSRWKPVAVLALGVLALHAWLLDAWPGPASRQAGEVAKMFRHPGARGQAVLASLTRAMPAPAPTPARRSEPQLSGHRAPPVQAGPPMATVPSPTPTPTPSLTPPSTPPAAQAVDRQAVARMAPSQRRAQADPEAVVSQSTGPKPLDRDASSTDPDGEPMPAADGAGVPVQRPPIYATRMPDPARLRYALRMGVGVAARQGEATLSWQHDGQGYRLDLDGVAGPGAEAGAPLIEQHSSGHFDAAGLAPDRFTDRRRGRRARAASFDREGGRVTFSNPRLERPAWPGGQDRLGWIVQLAAVARAAGRVPAEVAIYVVDARGAAEVWTFRARGEDNLAGPHGPRSVVRVLREPQAAFDWRVEAWLDPALDFWPVRLRMSLPGSGAVFELDLQGEPQPGPPGG